MKTQFIKNLFFISVIGLASYQAVAQTTFTTSKTAMELVKAAKKDIVNLTPLEVKAELAKGNVTLIDIREPAELEQNGVIAGAVSAPRGMLEFYADPATPYYKSEFNKDKRIILQCASGGRSALAVATLKQMGYTNIAHMDGGLKAWKEAGLEVVKKQ